MTDRSKRAPTVDVGINGACPCGKVLIELRVGGAGRFPTAIDHPINIAQTVAADFCASCSPSGPRDEH